MTKFSEQLPLKTHDLPQEPIFDANPPPFDHLERIPHPKLFVRRILHLAPPPNAREQHTMPVIDELKAQWTQYLGAAKIAWGKLTENELLECEGRLQKLAGLIQQRYAISRDEAERQVKSFFDHHRA
ncbi:CsbD family protein [Andreprevotia chitinilytica]|uniref:CsbD family protein n=1 Tax=Andreprevotia chitinilytica TaxID=396808 RepID=UPI001FE06256|nr:CsbD family protein [Andreprevotia chitinilytica]